MQQQQRTYRIRRQVLATLDSTVNIYEQAGLPVRGLRTQLVNDGILLACEKARNARVVQHAPTKVRTAL